MTEDATMPLMEAALELRKPYHTTQRLVLTGQLQGTREPRGWRVSRASVDAFKRRQDAARSSAEVPAA